MCSKHTCCWHAHTQAHTYSHAHTCSWKIAFIAATAADSTLLLPKAAAILFIILLSLRLTLQFDSVTAPCTPDPPTHPLIQLAARPRTCLAVGVVAHTACPFRWQQRKTLRGLGRQLHAARCRCVGEQGKGRSGKIKRRRHVLRDTLQLPLARAAKRAEVVVQFPIFSLQHKAKKNKHTHTHACKIMAGRVRMCVCVCVCSESYAKTVNKQRAAKRKHL